jgi:Na+-driven multidrug efflux pump
MNTPTPPLSPASESQLRLLAVFHFIFAGLALLGLVFLGLHYMFLDKMMDLAAQDPGQQPPPEAFLELFIWFYVVMGLFCVLGAVLNLLAARALRARRHWMLCAVVAGLNCLQIPVGTTLGVFTLVVINREDVRSSFRD